MNTVWRFIKRIWHDSVWSKVIAATIVAIASFLSGLLKWIWRARLSWLESVISIYESNPYEIATWLLGILLLIVSILFWRRSPKKDLRLFGIKWVRQLNIEELTKYGFLFWFPINKRLKTHSYDQRRSYSWGQISFDHIPEMRECIDRRVLRNTFEVIGQYSIEIDFEVYKYLEQVYEQERTLMNEKTLSDLDKYSTVSFDSLFPDVRQY